jgi:hypothetical protein
MYYCSKTGHEAIQIAHELLLMEGGSIPEAIALAEAMGGGLLQRLVINHLEEHASEVVRAGAQTVDRFPFGKVLS